MNTLYFSLQAPHHFFIIHDDDGKKSILKEGVFETIAEISDLEEPCEQIIGMIPGELVSIYDVEIPIRSRKQALRAIPYALEDQIASNLDDVEFFLLKWKPNKTSTVAIVDKQIWLGYMQLLGEHNIVLNQIVPDYALLPLELDDSAIVFTEKDSDRVLIRCRQGTIETGLVLNSDELPFWADDFDTQDLNVVCNDDLLHDKLSEFVLINATLKQSTIGETLSSVCTNLEQDNSITTFSLYESNQSKQTFDRIKPLLVVTSGLLMLAILAVIGLGVYEYWLLKSHNNQLDTRIESIFKQNFPSVEKIVDAKLQFQRELDKLKGDSRGSQEFLHLLDKVLKALPRNTSKVTELHYKESALDVIFSANNFEILDRFAEKLTSQNSVSFKRLSSDSQGGKVSAKYRFSTKQNGANNE